MNTSSMIDQLLQNVELVLEKNRDSLSEDDIDLLHDVQVSLDELRTRFDVLPRTEGQQRVTDIVMLLVRYFLQSGLDCGFSQWL